MKGEAAPCCYRSKIAAIVIDLNMDLWGAKGEIDAAGTLGHYWLGASSRPGQRAFRLATGR